MQDCLETASLCKSGSSLELHFAGTSRQLEDVKCYNLESRFEMNVLHMAAIQGDLEVFKSLITEINFNPACLDLPRITPLHLASGLGHLDMVKFLVTEQQVDPLCEDENGNTPLHLACAGGCQAVVEFLTTEHEKYALISELINNLRNKWNRTPLHSAASNGQLDILQFFISDQNCDPNISDQYGATLLHCAAYYGHLHI